VEADGLMAPVEASMLKPDGEAVNVPFAKAPVPVSDTAWAVATDVQKGPPYEITADGGAVTTTCTLDPDTL